jgi:hypothetical protein
LIKMVLLWCQGFHHLLSNLLGGKIWHLIVWWWSDR